MKTERRKLMEESMKRQIETLNSELSDEKNFKINEVQETIVYVDIIEQGDDNKC